MHESTEPFAENIRALGVFVLDELLLLEAINGKPGATIEEIGNKAQCPSQVAKDRIHGLVEQRKVFETTTLGGPPTFRITSLGETALRHYIGSWAENRHNCLGQLQGLGESKEDAERALTNFDEYMEAQVPTRDKLTSLMGSGPVDCRKWIRIHRFLSECFANPGEACVKTPLFTRCICHTARDCLRQRQNAEPEILLLDTNVLLAMTTRTSRHEAGKRKFEDTAVLSAVERLIATDRCTFIILDETLAEFKAVLNGCGVRCAAIELGGMARWQKAMQRRQEETNSAREKEGKEPKGVQDPERDFYEAARNELGRVFDLGLEYLLSPSAAPTYRDFVNDKCAEVLGLSQTRCSTILDRWSPRVERARDVVDKKLLCEGLARVAADARWSGRPSKVNEHDVAIVLAASAMRKRLARPVVVWTHHRSLSSMAQLLGEPASCVMCGPPLLGKWAGADQGTILAYFAFMLGHKTRITPSDVHDVVNALNARGDRSENAVDARLLEVLEKVVVPVDEWVSSVDEEAEQDTWSDRGIVADESRIARLHDISMWWRDASGAHGTLPVRVFSQKVHGERNVGAEAFQLCPHTVTHIDLPWALTMNRQPGGRPPIDLTTVDGQKKHTQLTRSRELDIVFVNVRSVLREAESRIEHSLKDGGGGWIRKDQDVVKILMSLRLSEDHLASHMPPLRKGMTVILYTGWAERYMPRTNSLDSRCWEGRHPWLVHPWLDSTAIQWLLEKEVALLGIDAPMADCPAYLWRDVENKALRGAFESECNRERITYPSYQPLHTRFLSSNRCLIESLHISEETAELMFKNQEKTWCETVGLLQVAPFRAIKDAVLARLAVEVDAGHI